MDNFRFSVPTQVFFGKECINSNTSFFSGIGTKAFIIASPYVKLPLTDIQTVLENNNIHYLIYTFLEENAAVESLSLIARTAAGYNPDIIIAIGGGTVLDSGKALNILLKYPEQDLMQVLYGNGMPFDKIKSEQNVPLITIPTFPGTGSEVTGFAVFKRPNLSKLVMSEKVFPTAAFLDIRYLENLSIDLIRAGAVDSLTHGIETYCASGSNIMSNLLAEKGFSLFREYKGALIRGILTDSDREKLMMASCIQGMAFMQAGSVLPRSMGFPGSYFKGLPHGIASGVLLHEYIRLGADRFGIKEAVRLCGFDSIFDMLEYIKVMMRGFDIEKEAWDWASDLCKLILGL